jgi:hypothetical protein
MAGLCVGREVRKGWELDAEVHLAASEHFQGSEAILNVGSRYDLSENATLQLAVGRNVHNSLGPRVSLLTYLGIQIRI